MSQEDINDEYLKNLPSKVEEITEDVEQLRTKQKDIVSGIKTDIKNWYKKCTIFIIGGFSLLTIYALFQIYTNVITKSQEFITSSITLKFAEPKITSTLNKVAENQAQEIIKNDLNPAIAKANLDINTKITSFEKTLKDFQGKYDSELKALAKEVEYIKNRNDILRLSDEAISTGNKASFNKLEEIYNTTTDNDIKTSSLSEILRVKQSFINTSRVAAVEVYSTNVKYGYKLINDEVPTYSLEHILLNDSNWQGRAKAAELLKQRHEKGVPDVLLEAAEKDKNLGVVAVALGSFGSLTNFHNPDVFDFHPAKEWWEQNKQEVEGKYK